MKARWVQVQPQPQQTQLYGMGMPQPPTVAGQSSPANWMAVDEDDEIVAYVNSSDGQTWTAMAGSHFNGSVKHGAFISEAAAKRKVEKWLHPQYDFAAQSTAWAYRTNP